MTKQTLWLSLFACCVATITIGVIQSKKEHPSPVEDVRPAQPLTEPVLETAVPVLQSTPVSTTSETVEVGDEPGPPAAGGDSVLGRSVTEPGTLTSEPSPSPLGEQTAVVREFATVSSPEIIPHAEVWSYPPLLQQNASNNFIRAMERLSNAKSEFDRYFALGDAAKSDFIFGMFQDAHRYATELLALDAEFKDQPWRDGRAVFEGNFVLGRIAAQEGRMEEAKQYLLEAGKITGSPVLGSFGPNMSLARDLLQRGEQKTVLEYFDLCRRFWSMGGESLTLWTEDVKAGRIPDFGANLLY